MKPEIKLFFDFEFTSLSPDAQPISLGIISQETKPCDFPEVYKGRDLVSWNEYQPKSFYAEFSDFDLNRCDNWVKENVVSKLSLQDWSSGMFEYKGMDVRIKANTEQIKSELGSFLRYYRDYNITFVCDCGTFDWYWMLQLLAEWEQYPCRWKYSDDSDMSGVQISLKEGQTLSDFIEEYNKRRVSWMINKGIDIEYKTEYGFLIPIQFIKIGLPKLPDNISPIPEDLNDLIAHKKGISIREAFDVERLGSFCYDNKELYNNLPQTHNSLFDAKVIKETYEKLKS